MNQQKNSDNVTRNRKGEHDEQIAFRVSRLFSIGTNWYFSTREGVDQGPFINRERAEYAVVKYIGKMQH